MDKELLKQEIFKTISEQEALDFLQDLLRQHAARRLTRTNRALIMMSWTTARLMLWFLILRW